MRPSSRLATAAAAAFGLLVGGAGVAAAESGTITDQRRDVVVNGKVGGDRTAAQQRFAQAADVKSIKFTHGSTYVSIRITFANLRRDADYGVRVDFAGKQAGRTGKMVLFSGVGTDVAGAYTADDQIGDIACGNGGPPNLQIRTQATYGRNGSFYLQMPRSCAGTSPSLKAKAIVTSGGFRNDPASAASYSDYVSSTKFKTAKWTNYVKAG